MSAPRGSLPVLFAVSEATPLVKTGGLADVAGALPGALRRLGADVRVLLPAYPAVLAQTTPVVVARDLHLLPGAAPADLLEARAPDGTPLYLLASALFETGGNPYVDDEGRDWPDQHLRFGSLSRMAALLGETASPLDWRPRVVHLNDWQTALAAAWLRWSPEPHARCLLSLHNMAFVGAFDPAVMPALGLPPESFAINGIEYYGRISFLKAGVYYADRLATVSPTYAREIQQEAFGGGLHGLLAARAGELHGILNGIDTQTWNPARDTCLDHPYDARRLRSKDANRSALRRQLELADDDTATLFGMVTRLTWQKGVDLVPAALEMLTDVPWQLVVLGSGERALETQLRAFAARHPQRVHLRLGYDEHLAHRIEAGADVFLMPSRFEPCGLNQFYSMRYGTPPVVRATGGLADSVTDTSEITESDASATGFVFETASAEALAGAMRRAIALRAERRRWRALQRNGMRGDYSWRRSAGAYLALYEEMLAGA